ncbi:hypothetical protein [Alteromonas sp. 14N.309.X.WAT.G.H12]|uniref:hypothetical protein n=1 Tax=Alteromonas sp. 14N.309.X.WAT.G.H12 TaxID=3120824 RepID=UPI002FD5867C
MKFYDCIDNLGKAKYLVNFHDETQTYPDGTPRLNVRKFTNKRKRDQFVRSLKKMDYLQLGTH